MDFVTIGKARFGLGPAYAEPKVAAALPEMEKRFKPQKQLIYFWDCESQKGQPDPRKATFAVRTILGIQIFDPSTGKLDAAETNLSRKIYVNAMLGGKRADVRKLVHKAIPPVKVPIPYSLLDKYRKDFHIKMYVKFKPMFFLAYFLGTTKKKKGPSGPDSGYMWIIMPRDFQFEIKLMSRCDGKEFVLDDDFVGTRDGDPVMRDIDEYRFKVDKEAREAAKAEGKGKSGK